MRSKKQTFNVKTLTFVDAAANANANADADGTTIAVEAS